MKILKAHKSLAPHRSYPCYQPTSIIGTLCHWTSKSYYGPCKLVFLIRTSQSQTCSFVNGRTCTVHYTNIWMQQEKIKKKTFLFIIILQNGWKRTLQDCLSATRHRNCHWLQVHSKINEPFTCVPLRKMVLAYRPLKSLNALWCHDAKLSYLPCHFVHFYL